MAEYKIEKNVQLPTDLRSKNTYPFEDMEVGDSIFIKLAEKDDAQRLRNRLAQASRNFGKKQDPEWTFVLRYMLESYGSLEVSGVRIWRKS